MSTHLSTAPAATTPAPWLIDCARSVVAFRIRHLPFTAVDGRFERFVGSIDPAGIHGRVNVASIDTGDPIRDSRLRSAGFFDADRYPAIAFHAPGPLDAVVTGTLTICGVTRPVVIEVSASDERDGELHLTARTAISRRDFGLTWSGLTKAGEVVVADRVDIRLDLVLLAM